jgi:hypothetical protein
MTGMDFLFVMMIVGMAVSVWVVIIRLQNRHATDDETVGRLPRRRRSGRRRRSSEA